MTKTIVAARRPVRKPPVIVNRSDYDRIAALAAVNEGRNPTVAQEILGEIERAKIVADSAMPSDVVAMRSVVTFRDDLAGTVRQLQLVYPNEADIAESRISILTPIGAALIGLRKGHSMGWVTRTGERRALTVLDVKQPLQRHQDDMVQS